MGYFNKSENRLIIYLADLDHFQPSNRFFVPLGIGSIASYCKSIYGDSIDISLFKNPTELIEKIRERPPHILGCSFFMWNSNLTLKVLDACKMVDEKIITVVGGPSTARNCDKFKEILAKHPSLDIMVLDQGEKSFSNIVNRVLEKDFDKELIFSQSIDGCVLRLNNSDLAVRGNIVAGGVDLNKFPSPYLVEYFDKFLEAGFFPSIETVRGCPHQCTFCCGETSSFLPLSVKNEETVYQELLYIQPRSHTKELNISDTNLGIMGERDLRICSFALDLYEKTGFPQITGFATTKHKTKTSNALMISLAGMTGYLYFALQTLTGDVLDKCKRNNIPVEMIEELARVSKIKHWPIMVDLIFGLPGETVESFMKTFDKVFLLGVESPFIYQLRLLPGTTIAEQERHKYGYKGKFRPISGQYGEYNLFPGQKAVRVIEAEEIACANNCFDFSGYLIMRYFGLITRLLVGSRVFSDTVFFLSSKNIMITDIFKMIMDNYRQYPRLKKLFDDYELYSRNELFDNEEDLYNQIAKDDRQWDDLLSNRGKFFKLELGFAGYCLLESVEILDDIKEIIFNNIKSRLSAEEIEDFNVIVNHDTLLRVIQNKGSGKLVATDIKKEIIVDENFDYAKWRLGDFGNDLQGYRLENPMQRVYYIDNFDFLVKKINEFSNFTGYLFYEKIMIWGPQNFRRLCLK